MIHAGHLLGGVVAAMVGSAAMAEPVPPACPPPPDKPLPFGCATELNLRAMLADPADLDRGQELAPANGQPAVDAVERHRQGKLPSPPSLSSSAGPGGVGANP